MDYVIEGAMSGGFALVAAPAEYAVTGVKAFVVSNDGVVYEKDFGDTTLEDSRRLSVSIQMQPGPWFVNGSWPARV